MNKNSKYGQILGGWMDGDERGKQSKCVRNMVGKATIGDGWLLLGRVISL